MYTYTFFVQNYSTIHSYQCQYFYFLFSTFSDKDIWEDIWGRVTFVLYITISILELLGLGRFSLRSAVRSRTSEISPLISDLRPLTSLFYHSYAPKGTDDAKRNVPNGVFSSAKLWFTLTSLLYSLNLY